MTPAVPEIGVYPGRRSTYSPALSVVTTVRNGAGTLHRAIDSVRAQKIADLEYIVTDAELTDGTIEFLKTSGDIVTYWQSEPDRGISDGFNKAVALSTGRYVAILNADDWLSPSQLATGLDTLEQTGADFVFGDLDYHGAGGKLLHRIQGDPDYARRIRHVMPALNHPTVIVRRSAYEKFGLFDTSLRYAMDYELLLRFHKVGCKGVYDPRMIGHMSLAGASDVASLRALREVRDISIRHGYSKPLAQTRYLFRILKDRTRRMIEKRIPPHVSAVLRGLVNKDFVRAK